MLKLSPINKTDFYKQSHIRQYPKNTTLVLSNLTARGTRMDNIDGVIHFGTQASVQMLVEDFDEHFFKRPKDEINEFKTMIDAALGGDMDVTHFEQLWDLQYLPLCFTALPEGVEVPLRVPMVQFWNTHPDFFWLTNFIETEFSTNTWGFITTATTANSYKQVFDKWINTTDSVNASLAKIQGHDFSYRGMFGSQAALMSGMAHLTSFMGTDTIPAIMGAKHYYDAVVDDGSSPVGVSVPATEHATMCAGLKDNELETFKRLITETYPSNIVSIVSDTWNLWDVVGGEDSICAKLHTEIMSREGKVVIRPDSGCPIRILCGYTVLDRQQMTHAEWDKLTEYERKGVVECLWDIFGGSTTKEGYKLLDQHIGAIYGDSITLHRAEEIMSRLANKGFASSNVVLGIGSFTYQGAVHENCIVTRDTHGMAIKATYVEVDGVGHNIFKDPITDDGLKKSAKGIITVHKDDDGNYYALDQSTFADLETSELKVIWCDGEWVNRTTFSEIRGRMGFS